MCMNLPGKMVKEVGVHGLVRTTLSAFLSFIERLDLNSGPC